MGQWAALGGTKEHKVIVQCIVLGLLSYSSNQSLHRCRNRPVIKNFQKLLLHQSNHGSGLGTLH